MTTIVLPCQSSRAGLGVAGYVLAGVDFTPYTDFIGTYTAKPIVPIQIFSSAMVLLGIIDDYEYFRYERNWYEPDTWEIDVNRYKTNVSSFALGGFIRYLREGEEHIGIIERIEKPLDEKGKGGERWKIIGRGVESVFALRVCMSGTDAGTGYHSSTATVVPALTFTFAATTSVVASADCTGTVKVGHYIYNSTSDTADDAVRITAISGNGITITLASAYAGTTGAGKAATVCGDYGETALRDYVDVECITTDAERIITGLTLAVDSERGSIVNYSARFNVLSDVLTDICKAASLSYRLVWSGTGLNFVFTVYEGSDVSSSVIISPEFGNVATFQYLESLLEMRNLLYMGGTGDAAARIVREVYDTTEPTGWSRRESFIEASDCADVAALNAKGAELLATVGDQTSLEVTYLQSNTFVYGVDFDLGDTITTVFPGVATVVSRIITVTEEWDENGEKITLGIGKEYPDLISIMRDQKRAYSAQSRR